jgi:predicted dehydrogenase
MRYGVIGCGKVFQKRHWPSLKGHPEIQVSMLCDVDEVKLASVSQETGISRITRHWEEVVDSSQVDAVMICTLPDMNLQICEAAAAAGKHIYVEKPVACTVTEGRWIVEAAKRAGVKLCVGHQRRFAECELKAREMILQGLIGNVFKIYVTHNLPNQPVMWPEVKWWDWKYLYSHGRWLHWAIHYVDLLCHLLEDTPVKAVCEIAQYGEGGPRLAEDNAWGLFRFQRGGMGIVEIGGSQHAVHPETLTREAEERMEICGTKGSIYYARGRGLFRTNIPVQGSGEPNWVDTITTPEPPDMYAQHRRLHEGFLASVRDGGPSPVSGEDAVRALEMILAGYLSMIESRAVTLPLNNADIQKIEKIR